VSVNVGAVREVTWRGRQIRTAIWKEPVDGSVTVDGVNLGGDDQADRRVHGGPDKAVYAYAAEDYRWWSHRLGRDVAPGTFGDNLTTAGIDLRLAAVGDRWQVGTAVLEVAQPRTPCFKLGIRMDEPSFVRLFAAAARPGAYLRIVSPGAVAARAAITVTPARPPGVKLYHLLETEQNRDLALRIYNDRHVPLIWRELAGHRLHSLGPEVGAHVDAGRLGASSDGTSTTG
jgi:MOSC domain-containing protein YiiM